MKTARTGRKSGPLVALDYVPGLARYRAPEEHFENEPITICVRLAASLSDPYYSRARNNLQIIMRARFSRRPSVRHGLLRFQRSSRLREAVPRTSVTYSRR